MVAEWAQDQLNTSIQVHLDWKDRLRVLFGRTMRVMVRTDCEVRPGRVDSVTTISVDPILAVPSRGGAMCAMAENDR